MSDVHLSGYQSRDYEVVDYEMYQDEETGFWFRGPRTDRPEGGYISCIGAAQTLGCFCERPYPDLLSEALGIPVLNFGYGGAGPSFFLRSDALLDTLNRGRAVVLQVMSGRSESNDLFEAGGLEFLTSKATGEKIAAQQAYRDLLAEHALKPNLPPPVHKAIRMFVGPEEIRQLLRQTRDNWVNSNLELMAKIEVPVIVLWFSRRPAWLYKSGRLWWWWQRYDNVNAMFGDYPQFITQAMLDRIKLKADDYVHCVTRRGSPQPLFSRFTGEPVVIDRKNDRQDLFGTFSQNAYYPSPEMHEDAAAALLPACRRILDGRGT